MKMRTISGKLIDILNPDPELINLDDIAHHLMYINRYNGATRFPYSVAQHSIYVSQETNTLEGLMHDAHEAYIGDVSTPVKTALGEAWEKLEAMWEDVIITKFHLDRELLADVKPVDVAIRMDEQFYLQGVLPADDDDGLGIVIEKWSRYYGKNRFKLRFEELNATP